jgi:murein DD-endopeptidase MepM/ murein hydrolase activator NlpD
MARNNTNRVTPDAVRDYNLNPAASVVDKQGKYTPQLGDAASLKNTADSLSKLAKGINDVRYVAERQANDNAIAAVAKTEEKNRSDWAEVSKNIKGMAKFNPYNEEAYKSLRAKANMEEGIYELAKLEAYGTDLDYGEFEAQRQQIINQTVQNMNGEGLKAKHTAGYLTKLQNQSFALKDKYITKKAEKDYQIFQNQIVSSTSKDIATLTYLNPNGFIEGWNEAVKNLEDVANGVGIDNTKKTELLYKTINQYLTDNVDDIDAEDFMVAISQTKIGGKPLSDFDPNYATSMKQLLIKAKSAKYEMDSLDLKVEKLRLEKASMAANTEMFNFMADPNKSDAEILNKANELIEAGGMEAIGMDYLKQIVNDKQTLFNLRTTQTKPEVYENLTQKFITKELTQEDIVNAVENKELGAKDASYLFNALNSDAQETYSEQFKAIKELYMDTNSTIDLGEQNKAMISKSVMDTISNPNLTKAQKAQALIKIKGVAEHMNREQEIIKNKSPMKLLTAAYMDTQKSQTQDIKEAQRYLAQMGLFKNQINKTDSNIRVTSAMQQEREVTLSDGTTVKRRHNGTDVATYQGRQIYAPMTGKVVASGYEKSMGNYILFDCEGKGYIKLMHLQSAELPKANTYILKGKPLAYVGNTGAVSSKDGGVLHVECFDRRMRLVNPKQFIKGS